MADSALITSTLQHPVALLGSESLSSPAVRLTSASGGTAQNTSSLEVLADDFYTPSSSAAQQRGTIDLASQANVRSQTTADNGIALEVPTAFLPASSLAQSGCGGQEDSAMDSAVKTAEQDGIAVAQWMKAQVTIGDPSQAASPTAGDMISAGASLVAKFSNDLDQIGSIIDQTVSSVANSLQGEGSNSSEISFETNALKSSLTLNAIDSLANAIGAATNGSGENSGFGFSDTALSLGSSSTDGVSQLSLHISNYNQPSGTVNSAHPYDFSLVFDSTDSSAVASEASSSAASDGSVTCTAVAAASHVEQYTMYTVGQVQTGAGQSTLTAAAMSGTISDTVGVGLSETTDGSESSQAAVEIDTNSESENLSMVSTTIHAVPSGNMDDAPITNWNAALDLSTWGTMPTGGSPAKAEFAILQGIQDSQNAAAPAAARPSEAHYANAYADRVGSEHAAGRGHHRVDIYA